MAKKVKAQPAPAAAAKPKKEKKAVVLASASSIELIRNAAVALSTDGLPTVSKQLNTIADRLMKVYDRNTEKVTKAQDRAKAKLKKLIEQAKATGINDETIAQFFQ